MKFVVTVVKHIEAVAEIEVYADDKETAEIAAFDKALADKSIAWDVHDTDTFEAVNIEQTETVS